MVTTKASAQEWELQPDDVLGAILAIAKRESKRSHFGFRAHDSDFQSVVNSLSKEFPELSQVFVFSDSGPKPYSPVLSEAISRLQLAGLVGRENPDYEVIFLRPAAEEYYDKVLVKRLEAHEERLQEIGRAFLSKVTPSK
jgi:hypothetical protein